MTKGTPLAPSASDAAVAAERVAAWVIGALTAIVIGGVALVIYGPHGGHAAGSSWLPGINAPRNATAQVLLSSGYVFIRRRRIAAHRACMIAAFAASSLFLITYLIHRARVGSVPFHGAGWLRPVYLGLLVPHIVLAALVVPLALTTIYRAWRGHFDRHRRLARVTPPIWLYVSVSGVLVYVLLYDARSLRRNGRRRRVLVPLPIGGRRAALNGGDDEKAALRGEVEEDAPVPEAPTIGPGRLFRELQAVAGGGGPLTPL